MDAIDRLRNLGEEGLAALLRERPALLNQDRTMAGLARFVETPYALSEALCHANAFEHAVAEAVAALAPARPADIAAALGVTVDGTDTVDAAVTTLERLFVVVRQPDGRVVPSIGLGPLFDAPLGLGRPLTELLPHFDVSALRRAAELLGVPRTGTKAVIAAALSRALHDPDRIRSALRGAPKGTDDLVERLLSDVVVDVGYGRPPPPVAWLLERLMLVRAAPYAGPAQLSREVALALRGPVLLEVPATPPPLSGRLVRDVDASAAHKADAVLTLVASVLDALAATPAKAIVSGDLGVRDLKRLAKAADTDEATVGRLLEMARSADLVGALVTPVEPKPRRGRGWQPDPAPLVEWLPTTGYDTWLALDPAARWVALATAWLDSQAWPSRSGACDPAGKTTTAFSVHHDAVEAPRFRRLALGLLAGLGAGEAALPVELAATLSWHRFRSAVWGGTGSLSLTQGILAEAELLGVVTEGALSTLGRSLLDGGEAAAKAAGRTLPTPVRTFLVQADLTAIAAGPLERDIAEELSAMADVSSRGVATIWRFSEASVRRALDQGVTPARMLAFLDDHAAKGVPQALRYLVNDAARRHGKLRVAAVGCVVTSDDPALLAEVRVSRKTAKLGFRELAPTVLASHLTTDVVLRSLRSAGFLPVEELAAGSVSVAPPTRRRAPTQRAASSGEPDVVAVARRLLADRSVAPISASRQGDRAQLDELATLMALAKQLAGDDRYNNDDDDDDEPGWWAPEPDDDGSISPYGSAHEMLAKAESAGTEIAVLVLTGRKQTEVMGTVALLNTTTVVIRDDLGSKKIIPLGNILSMMEIP